MRCVLWVGVPVKAHWGSANCYTFGRLPEKQITTRCRIALPSCALFRMLPATGVEKIRGCFDANQVRDSGWTFRIMFQKVPKNSPGESNRSTIIAVGKYPRVVERGNAKGVRHCLLTRLVKSFIQQHYAPE